MALFATPVIATPFGMFMGAVFVAAVTVAVGYALGLWRAHRSYQEQCKDSAMVHVDRLTKLHTIEDAARHALRLVQHEKGGPEEPGVVSVGQLYVILYSAIHGHLNKPLRRQWAVDEWGDVIDEEAEDGK